MICENCSDVNCRFRNLIGDYCNDYKLKEKQMENKLTEQQFREIAKYINIEYVGGSHGMNEQSIESSLRDLKQKGLVFEIPQNKCKHKRLKEDENMVWCTQCGKILL